MTEIIYPTVDLFIYDLGEGLGQNSEQITSNRRRFCKKVYADLESEAATHFLDKLKKAEEQDTSYVDLGGIPLGSDLDGNYYPILLEDTYALKINYSGKKRTQQNNPEPLETLRDLKRVIVSKVNHQPDNAKVEPKIVEDKKGTIGETWLVWGQLTENHEQDYKQVAEECYKQLAPKNFPKLPISESGKLLGGQLFEFNYYTSPQERYHLLVWLFPPGENLKDIQKKVPDIYFDLIRLFCDRNKVIFSYEESHKLKNELKEQYRLVRESINELTQERKHHSYSLNRLQDKLTKNLQEISDYTDKINRLNAQGWTIKVNLENYRKRLKMIAEKDKDSQLKILAEFRNFAAEKYQSQIESDYAYLSPGLTLLENLIRTIEGIMQIEQTKSDRNIERNIAIAGFGIGAASTAASSVSPFIETISQRPLKNDQQQYLVNNAWSNFGGAFFISLGTGMLFGSLTWIVWIILAKRRK